MKDVVKFSNGALGLTLNYFSKKINMCSEAIQIIAYYSNRHNKSENCMKR